VFNGTNATVIFNESISFLSYAVFVDATPPGITIKFLDAQDNEKTTFQATDIIKIVCTRSSATANSATAASLVPSFNDTNISVAPADSSSFDVLGTDATRDTASTDFTIEYSETRELGDYTVACYSIDDLGGINDTVNTTFTIVTKPPRSSSAFANPSFQRPEGQKIVTQSEDLGVVTEQGTSRLMKKGSVVKVDVKGETHTITVKDLTTTAVTLTVASTPQDITINKGETTEVDVDGDGQNDLAITFHQQYKTGTRATADITLKAISTPAEPKKDTTKQPTTTTTDESSVGSSAGTAIVTIIVIIAVIVIGFALIRGKKR
ncbi:MAG TPA: hypothetical protein VJH37_01485, partial [Candidatus Nanoarchaeia archaeon]|nr:hypothetical protein [Candidatus Nanoarchaeia archaeon]